MNDQIPVEEFVPSEVGELDLYQKRERIYTRKVEGFFQRIRLYTGWPLLIAYFLLPWVQYDGRQAIWFDLPERQFNIFAITFWPQDFPLLAWALIISAFTLFAVTTFVGRVWCGYTCPQTVWTSIFMWAEQTAEGTANQRRRLDEGPWDFNKILRKLFKHGMWLTVALATGLTFVGYFVPIRELIFALPTGQASGWAYSFVTLFTVATYINAGWMREQVCLYMCPYARFQSVMFDNNTLIVSYDPNRGEPRGSRKKGIDPKNAGLGDCIDCKLCVQVCPTGIDIRNGLQYECISCALCIDACDSVMDKMNYPRGLIRYTTENTLEGKPTRILRPRLIGYAIAITVMVALFVGFLVNRVPLGIEVLRERGELYQETGTGLVENVYTLKLRNMSQNGGLFRVRIEDLPGASLIGNTDVTLASGEVLTLPVTVQVERSALSAANVPMTFVLEALDGRHPEASRETRFLGPVPSR